MNATRQLLKRKRKRKFKFQKKKKSILDLLKLKFKILAIIVILIILLYNIYLLITKNIFFQRKQFNNYKKNNSYSNFEKNDNKTKVCLCVLGKKENLYIKEFVMHYEKLGFNHIFLYDNNDQNDERFEDIIQDEINKGFVSLINYRSYRGEKDNPQYDAYYDCYEKHNKNYNWIAFFDIDEYLEIKPNNITILEF